MTTLNTQHLTLGMAQLEFTEDTSTLLNFLSHKVWNIGNIVVASIAPEVTYLDHYTVNNGTRKKDRSLITNKALAINFTFDEITGGALKEFLLASASSGAVSASGFKIYPMAKGEIKGCAKLTFETEFGRDFTWEIPCAALKPDGTFDFNAEDWMNAKGIIECLVDETAGADDKPFGTITYDDDEATINYS